MSYRDINNQWDRDPEIEPQDREGTMDKYIEAARERFIKVGAPPHRDGDRYCSCSQCTDKVWRAAKGESTP